MKHYVYKTSSGELVVIAVRHGELVVMGNSISPEELVCIDTFEADGISDFNWGMVGAALKTKAKGLYKKALRIAKKGL